MPKKAVKKTASKPAASKRRVSKKVPDTVGTDILIYTMASILVATLTIFVAFG